VLERCDARAAAEQAEEIVDTQPLAAVDGDGQPGALSPVGYLRVDDHQRTSVPGLFAAGDVADGHSHQVATAVHEGATAAQAANHALYPARQRI